MIKLMCALYDRKAEMFLDPFFVPTIGVAARDIGAEVNRSGEPNRLRDFRTDFELWHLGNFDSESGFVEFSKAAKVCDVASLFVGAVAPAAQLNLSDS